MSTHAKAASAGSIEGSGLFRRAFAIRGGSSEAEGSGARSFGVLGLGVLLIASFTALLGAASVQAAPAVHTYKSTETFTAVPNFTTAQVTSRVAIEPGTGNLLLSDGLTGSSVEVLAPNGTQLTTFAVPGPGSLATDPGNGAVYYAQASGTISRYTSDGAPTPTYTADGSFTSPPIGSGAGEIAAIADIAVDPSTHDLLVVDPSNNRVSRLSSSGSYLNDFDGGDAPSAGFAEATDIDVGPTGEILVVASDHVDRFDTAGVAKGELPGVGAPGSPGRMYVAINPATGAIVVSSAGGAFAPPPNLYLYKDAEASPEIVPLTASGGCCGAFAGALAVGGPSSRTYAFYIDVFGLYIAGLEVFDAAVKPGVDQPVASQIDVHSMHLHGTVDSGEDGTIPNPAGITDGIAYFELTAPGAPTVRTPDQSYTPADESIDADVTGLLPNTTYSVKLFAQNSQFPATESAPKTVTTTVSAPEAVTGVTTDVTGSSAVLHGLVTAYGLQTTYYFEYGTTDAYGSKVPTGAPAPFGVSYTPRPVQRTIEGLAANTTYHYRLVATNSAGTTFGVDETFTASPAEGARGYEMVTPTDKGGGAIDTTEGFHARADGAAVMYHPTASFGTVDGTSSPLQTRYLARRDPATNWGAPWQVDPPLLTHRNELAAAYTTLAVSEDFSRALVVSNRKLTPDALPIDGTDGADLYLRDTATGSYTFVGGSMAPTAFATFTDLVEKNTFRGASEDFSTVVFESGVPLTPDALENQPGIYRWSAGGGLELISKLPAGKTAPGVVRSPTRDLVQTVSADGQRAAFQVSAGSPDDGLYLWEDGDTRAISVSHRPGDPNTIVPASLAGVSSDGRYVTFIVNSADPLTDDAQAVTGNIYRLDLAGGGSGSLELLFDGPNVGILRAGRDGSHLYVFGQPTPSDPRGYYVWGPEGVQYVSPVPAFFQATAVSPNGRYLAFTATTNSAEGTCNPELDPDCVTKVYLYDYESDELSCASCLRDGSPSTDDAELMWFVITDSNRYPRVVLDDGRVFFSTPSRLVAGDVNDRFDAYSFRDGRATLVSPGTGPYSARFMDASADGRDVFIATDQPLSPRDLDGEYDYYDAREGSSGDPASESRAQCGGECAAVAPAPGAAATATQTTSGPASKVRRAKQHRKKHAKKKRKAAAKRAAHRTAHNHGRLGK